jgi:hypothetical protein
MEVLGSFFHVHFAIEKDVVYWHTTLEISFFRAWRPG